jgi:hypothetical protein
MRNFADCHRHRPGGGRDPARSDATCRDLSNAPSITELAGSVLARHPKDIRFRDRDPRSSPPRGRPTSQPGDLGRDRTVPLPSLRQTPSRPAVVKNALFCRLSPVFARWGAGLGTVRSDSPRPFQRALDHRAGRLRSRSAPERHPFSRPRPPFEPAAGPSDIAAG